MANEGHRKVVVDMMKDNENDSEVAVEILEDGIAVGETTENDKVPTPTKRSNEEITKDGNDEVEVLTAKEAKREWRRKRRRKLLKILQGPNAVPSFLAVLQQPLDDDDEDEDVNDDDDDESIPPPKIVIDVDEYLGLGYKAAGIPSAVVSNGESYQSPQPVPSAIPSNVTSGSNAFSTPSTTPAEEGYYEGVVSMAMPEDEKYVSELQQWIRQHLEFFSATELDSKVSHGGRRVKAVRGKVGYRCIHCAKALLPQLKENSANFKWPAGAVGYPINMNGLYAACSQRPQLHFESCPYLPHEARVAGTRVWSPLLTGTGTPGIKRVRMKEGISALMYYHISCQRIGLVETPVGLRFTRDLELEPLPFDEVRHKVEEEHPELLPSRARRMVPHAPRSSGIDSLASPPKVKLQIDDETCKKVLQEALDEDDDLEKRLACKKDSALISDYTFLAIKQMSICHGEAIDFASRGKKTRLMRLGFAGFCCRHCHAKNIAVMACRSFLSAPDNIASAISNSFIPHLLKCPHTPDIIKEALLTLKKSHALQMTQLPYGSQRRLFFELWKRLRAVDKNVEGQESGSHQTLVEGQRPDPVPSTRMPSNNIEPIDMHSLAFDSNRKNARGETFPVTSNEEAAKVLKASEENWNLAENDNLMLREDRHLVSDYVFLTMRQLKIAIPTLTDFRGNRRNNIVDKIAGMCCRHCADSTTTFISPSGRTFPSAPDNMASAFNSSLYNHMQNCPGVSLPLKHAFRELRKIHSVQCQNLTFGSQRRFFNKVYAKLKAIPIPAEIREASNIPKRSAAPMIADIDVLQKHSFMMGESHWQCLKCRAVPFDFRAPGAVHFSCPSTLSVEKHSMSCQSDGIHLGLIQKAKEQLITKEKVSLSDTSTFEDLIGVVVGGDEELIRLFTKPEDPYWTEKTTSGLWRRLPLDIEFERVQSSFEKLAAELSLHSNQLQKNSRWVNFLHLVSPNFQCPVLKEEVKETQSTSEEAKTEGSMDENVTVSGAVNNDSTAPTLAEVIKNITASIDKEEENQEKGISDSETLPHDNTIRPTQEAATGTKPEENSKMDVD